MNKKKVYLAHTISTRGEATDSERVAALIEDVGFDVYAAIRNKSINDKANNPKPIDIYYGDTREIDTCDIFVVSISGGLQDGTIGEVMYVAGLNRNQSDPNKVIPIVGYTSNARLLNPQFYKGIPSAGANHLILGAIDKWGEFVGTEEAMLKKLEEMK